SKIISKIYFSERINKLQQRDRYLINLKYNFDLKNRDIAKLLNMDEKLVSKKIRKIEKSIGKEDL
ncbi:sigma factor-like helix-turn-helix DNA-binding protein, partial [Intestinibacter bartlettii]